MASVNKVILIGNLGADPEIKTFDNGGMVANFRIATTERWKDKNSGELKENNTKVTRPNSKWRSRSEQQQQQHAACATRTFCCASRR